MREPNPSNDPAEIPVLVLLDQPLIAEVVRLTLKHGAFVTHDAQTSAEALRALREWQPHLAVIDMELGSPELLERISGTAEVGSRIPVLGLTRRGDLKSKLNAFDHGVDDIVTMPFSPEELLARALAANRRAYGGPIRLQGVLKLGAIELDILNRRVLLGADEVPLSALEQSLLYLLVANAGRVITRDEMLDALWGSDFVAESNFVDPHVRGLRAKLKDDWRKPRFIATVAGQGYRFIPSAAEDRRVP